MQRQKAIDVIKEIGNSCKLLNPKAISIQHTTEKEQYEIHVNGHIDDETWECLKTLAKKNELGIKLTNHTLVIHGPEDKKYGKLVFK